MSTDPWNIGHLHKKPIWGFYGLSNYVGVILCVSLIYFIARNPKRTCSDIFVCGLSSGCISLSITCGTQCFLSLAAGRFYGAEIACQFEAVAHISSVLTEFFCVATISINMYWEVVRKQKIEQKTALKIIVGIWLTCLVVTGLLSLCSPIYLMSAGTYCFFGFSSAAIAGWLVPGLIISLSTMLYCHITVMKHFKAMVPKKPVSVSGDIKLLGQNSVITNRDVWAQQFQWRSTLYMITILIGWGFAAVTTIYELAVGRSAEWLVTAVGVGGVSFSWWCPLVYSHTSPYYRDSMTKLFYSIFCFWRRDKWESHRRTMRTRTGSLSRIELTSGPSDTLSSSPPQDKSEEGVKGSSDPNAVLDQKCVDICRERSDPVSSDTLESVEVVLQEERDSVSNTALEIVQEKSDPVSSDIFESVEVVIQEERDAISSTDLNAKIAPRKSDPVLNNAFVAQKGDVVSNTAIESAELPVLNNTVVVQEGDVSNAAIESAKVLHNAVVVQDVSDAAIESAKLAVLHNAVVVQNVSNTAIESAKLAVLHNTVVVQNGDVSNTAIESAEFSRKKSDPVSNDFEGSAAMLSSPDSLPAVGSSFSEVQACVLDKNDAGITESILPI